MSDVSDKQGMNIIEYTKLFYTYTIHLILLSLVLCSFSIVLMIPTTNCSYIASE